jgi:hypothetical protein
MGMIRVAVLSLLAALTLGPGPVLADEGMWTFDNFPVKAVQKAYGVTIDPAWLDHVRLSTLRLTSGCSGAVASGHGLALTNYHCVVDCVTALSAGGPDLMAQGFHSAAASEERRCPGLQAEILVSWTDVTRQLRAATGGVGARDAVIARLEKDGCGLDPLVHCQVTALYHGAQYMLYRFRRYTDVRLVFAPEFDSAFFGGDPDNFNFPRYDLDVAFIRLYVDGVPASTPERLAFDEATPRDGQPVFVAGNPGGTARLSTLTQLEVERDVALPPMQLQRSEERGRLLQYAAESPAHTRATADVLFSLENNFKVFVGRQKALSDPAFLEIKRRQEAELRAKVASNSELRSRIGDPWADMDAAQMAYRASFLRYAALEAGAGNVSQLYDYARILVRGAAERGKPDSERLREFGDARLPPIEKALLDSRPIDVDLETVYLAFWLSKTREYLGVDDPAVKALLGADSPEAVARRLAAGTRLADPAVRKALWEGGRSAIEASSDPMIRFVAANDAAARAVRRAWEDQVSGPTDEAAGRIAQAAFAVYGGRAYPDATFTPRLSFGRVAGWTYQGTKIAPFTRFSGLYARATGAEPFKLPPSWLKAQPTLDADTVFNLSTSTDIIGGNSGSALIDAEGRMIGVVFDGNIHSLGGDYLYDGALNRSVALSSAAIGEALAKVYGDTRLLNELREP